MSPYFSSGGIKSSHLQSPRTQRDTTYWHGGDPYDYPQRQPRRAGRWALFIVFAIVALSMLGART